MFNSQKLPSIDTITNGGDSEAFTTTTTFANSHTTNGSLSNGNSITSQEEQQQQQQQQQKTLNLDSSPSPSILSSSSSESVMSINRLCNEPIERAEEMVVAEALQNLSRGATDNPPPPAPIEPSATPNSPTTNGGFASRIHNNKFVRRTIDIYESGKRTSPLLKYGADAIESGIKKMTRPIVGALPEQLDEYACRGLDKLESVMDTNTATITTSSTKTKNGGGEDMNTQDQESRRRRSEGHRPSTVRPHRSSNGSNFAPYSYPTNNNSVTTSTAPRSRWHAMLVGTSTVVGGVGAAVSEESMKSLKYCLHWLHYASQQIEHQIAVLREFIVKLTGPSSNALIQTSASSTLGSIKRDVVDTLRKVIEVVSKYAGVCLPEQARQNVREFILTLPSRWASINRTEHSATPSPMSSPQMNPANNYPHNQTTDYARRLLSLATESSEMLTGVTSVFGETVERAEFWVGRLRDIGVTTGGSGSNIDLEFENIPSSQLNGNGTRSRRTSSSKRVNSSTHRNVNSLNGIDYTSSSESEAENKRMEMDHRHSIKSTTVRSSGMSTISAKKRQKKSAKKEEHEKMDLS